MKQNNKYIINDKQRELHEVSRVIKDNPLSNKMLSLLKTVLKRTFCL